MAHSSFGNASWLNYYGVGFGPIVCDPFPVIDKEAIIGAAVGLLVAASPIGG